MMSATAVAVTTGDAPPPNKHHVVIVGAGIAGLTCARELLLRTHDTVRVTLVEADDRVGGRIRADTKFVPGHVFDLGAEFIHGKGTLLTELIEDLQRNKAWKHSDHNYDAADEDFFEEIFITSHADGGPDEQPTSTGKYGMYYVGGELLMYNDPILHELHDALEEILEDTVTDPEVSFQDALLRRQPPLSAQLHALAIASYGNSAACSNLADLSLSMITAFEKHWEENEIEGDYRLPSRIGMHGVVQGLLDMLTPHPNFELRLQSKVQDITQDSDGVQIGSCDGVGRQVLLRADAVVVTVPPPVLAYMNVDLSAAKQHALSFVGFERVIKVCAKFKTRPWPTDLQSIVCAASGSDHHSMNTTAIPEMWFREFVDVDDADATVYVAVGYLTSAAADDFIANTTNSDIDAKSSSNDSLTRATDIFLRQLTQVLSVPLLQLLDAHQETLLYDWKDDCPSVHGGYVYPKSGATVEVW